MKEVLPSLRKPVVLHYVSGTKGVAVDSDNPASFHVIEINRLIEFLGTPAVAPHHYVLETKGS